MNDPATFLRALAERLCGGGIPWMLTGSTASSFYREPKADMILLCDRDFDRT